MNMLIYLFYIIQGDVSPWSVVSVLVTLLSESVRDVEQVLWALLNNPASQCTAAQLLQVSIVFIIEHARGEEV